MNTNPKGKPVIRMQLGMHEAIAELRIRINSVLETMDKINMEKSH